MNFDALNNRIDPPDAAAGDAARARWNAIAKPIGSLGLLEEAVVQMAALTGSAEVRLTRRAVLVFCADNGVVAEGVTQTGPEVTALVAGNMLRGDASVCRMARVAGAEIFPLDLGMNAPVPGLRDLAVARGTGNMSRGPAMSRAQALQALETGMALAKEYKDAGFHLLITGEMGIGNTTTASAVTALLCGLTPEEATGRGAGLSAEGLGRKVDAIRRAIEVNRPDKNDPLDVLAKLGGFDIAAMAGLFMGGALHRIPVLIDGFISAAAALVARRLCPACDTAMLATHVSAEPAARAVLKALGKEPMIAAGLRLGEGTGALCALPMLDMALAVYNDMASFSDIGLKAYEVMQP